MSSKPIVPSFSGERMHGETIEGYYFSSRGDSFIEQIELSEPTGAHRVKPETLRISFNNGEKFYTMDQIKDGIYLYEQAMEDNHSTNFPVNFEGL